MIDINQLIDSVDRELKKRKWVYPRMIENGKLSEKKASHELLCMQSLLHLLGELRQAMNTNSDSLRLEIMDTVLKQYRVRNQQGELF